MNRHGAKYPMLGQFLSFILGDIAVNPERLVEIDEFMIRRIDSLVGNIEINLDEVLPTYYESEPR